MTHQAPEAPKASMVCAGAGETSARAAAAAAGEAAGTVRAVPSSSPAASDLSIIFLQ
nr:hypothetical protein GCM10020092_063420 [Actinoplanes digitatis]